MYRPSEKNFAAQTAFLYWTKHLRQQNLTLNYPEFRDVSICNKKHDFKS
jgi:hypothetical protein